MKPVFNHAKALPRPPGKDRVALRLHIDFSKIKHIGNRQCGAVDLSSTGDEHITPVITGGVPGDRERGGEIARRAHARRHVATGSGHDNIRPTGQWYSDRLKGTATHDDGAPHGALTKVPEIGRQMPRKTAITSDDAVSGDGGNQHNAHEQILQTRDRTELGTHGSRCPCEEYRSGLRGLRGFRAADRGARARTPGPGAGPPAGGTCTDAAHLVPSDRIRVLPPY